MRTHHLARYFSGINVFGRAAGFCELKVELEKTNPAPSVSRIRSILAPIHEIREVLAPEFLLWFSTTADKVFDTVMRMSDEDLKNDFRAASDSVLFMSTLYRYSQRADAGQVADMRRLQFALKGFRSPFLERRLNSLNDINDIIEVLDSKDPSVRDEEYGPFWVTKDFMCNWLAENDILDSIFTRNLHLEILKRSYRILCFLALHERLGCREIEMIWEVAVGKHESIQKSIYELLTAITRCLQPELLRVMIDLIRNLPHSNYTAQHMETLKHIAHSLVKKETKKELDYRFVGPEILWSLIQDEVRFSQPELHLLAVEGLTSILELNECRGIRTEYFAKCVKNVERHKSVLQSLTVMEKLINTIASKRKKPEVGWGNLDGVNDEHHLVTLVIDDLVHYHQCVPASSTVSAPIA